MSEAGAHDAQESGREADVIYRTRHDPETDPELSTSILLALDNVIEEDIERSETIVFDYVDLEAIDALLAPSMGSDRECRVTFEIERFEVTATAAGDITIRSTDNGQP